MHHRLPAIWYGALAALIFTGGFGLAASSFFVIAKGWSTITLLSFGSVGVLLMGAVAFYAMAVGSLYLDYYLKGECSPHCAFKNALHIRRSMT